MDSITPAEALEKTCPFMSREYINGNGSVIFSNVKCIADKCMSWKPTKPLEDTGKCCLLSK